MKTLMRTGMVMIRGSLAMIFLLNLLITNSCKKDIDFSKEIKLPEWNPNLAAPAVTAKLTIADLLNQAGEQEYLQEDENGFLTVYHRSSLLSQTAGDIISFDTQEEDTTVNIPFPVFLPAGDSVTLSYRFSQTFSNNYGDVVDSIRFKSGNFEISVESMMDHDARLILVSPWVTKNGVPLREEVVLNYSGSVPVVRTVNINLQGYSFHFDHAGNQNNLRFYYDIVLYGDQNPNPGPFNVKVGVKQTNMQYRALFGQIKTRNIELLQDEIDIGFFEKGLGGQFWINDPRIGIHFSNSFGLPLAVTIDPLKGHSDVTYPYDVELSGPGLPKPFVLNAPTLQQVGESVASSLVLNKSNSNIDDFLNLMPQKVEYAVNATVNPTGLVAGNFVLDTSHFKVDLELEIPLEGYANGFTLQDTVPFSIDKDSLPLDLEWVLFRVFAESTFPLEARLQVTFLDSTYQVLDSLFKTPQAILPGAVPGPPPLYLTSQPATKIVDMKIDGSKMDKLDNVEYLFLTAYLNTGGGGGKVVRVYTDQYLEFRVGVQTKFKVDPNTL